MSEDSFNRNAALLDQHHLHLHYDIILKCFTHALALSYEVAVQAPNDLAVDIL